MEMFFKILFFIVALVAISTIIVQYFIQIYQGVAEIVTKVKNHVIVG